MGSCSDLELQGSWKDKAASASGPWLGNRVPGMGRCHIVFQLKGHSWHPQIRSIVLEKAGTDLHLLSSILLRVQLFLSRGVPTIV